MQHRLLRAVGVFYPSQGPTGGARGCPYPLAHLKLPRRPRRELLSCCSKSVGRKLSHMSAMRFYRQSRLLAARAHLSTLLQHRGVTTALPSWRQLVHQTCEAAARELQAPRLQIAKVQCTAGESP